MLKRLFLALALLAAGLTAAFPQAGSSSGYSKPTLGLDNSGNIYVRATNGSTWYLLGAVTSGSKLVPAFTASAHQFVTGFASGAWVAAQPQFSDLGGSATAAQLPAFTGGDCTTSAGSVALACTKTNGVAFSFFATLANLSGDCTTGGTGAVTCLKTNGVSFGTMATQNASAVAVTGGTINGANIGQTTPAAVSSSSGSLNGTLGAGTPAPATVTNLTVNGTAALGSSASATTQSVSDATTKVATDAFVQNQIAATPLGQGFRNRIINGDMSIDQRNSGAAQTITAGAALAYTVDRWYAYSTGANVTGQQVTNTGSSTSPSQKAYQFTGAASVTGIGFCQRISARNSYDLANSSAIFSANLDDSLLTTVSWALSYANTADTFGTLAAPTVTSIQTGTFTVSSTSTRYTSPAISIPSAATTGLQLCFTVAAQTSGTLHIGNVQLESGAAATGFERRQGEFELSLAQSYFVRPNITISTQSYSAGAGGNIFIQWSAPTTMRATPTITASWGSLTNATANAINALADSRTLQSSITSSAAGNFAGGLTITSLSAEL